MFNKFITHLDPSHTDLETSQWPHLETFGSQGKMYIPQLAGEWLETVTR